jgi:hypothetical protein
METPGVMEIQVQNRDRAGAVEPGLRAQMERQPPGVTAARVIKVQYRESRHITAGAGAVLIIHPVVQSEPVEPAGAAMVYIWQPEIMELQILEAVRAVLAVTVQAAAQAGMAVREL